MGKVSGSLTLTPRVLHSQIPRARGSSYPGNRGHLALSRGCQSRWLKPALKIQGGAGTSRSRPWLHHGTPTLARCCCWPPAVWPPPPGRPRGPECGAARPLPLSSAPLSCHLSPWLQPQDPGTGCELSCLGPQPPWEPIFSRATSFVDLRAGSRCVDSPFSHSFLESSKHWQDSGGSRAGNLSHGRPWDGVGERTPILLLGARVTLARSPALSRLQFP